MRTLRTMLEASIAIEEHGGSEPLREAIVAHRATLDRRAEQKPTRDTGERDRTSELRDRPGWAWTRLFRRYDQYEIALRQLEALKAEDEAPDAEREPTLV